MATGIRPLPITIPTDTVTLHRWHAGSHPAEARAAGVFGDRLGDPIRVGEPGTVTFPAHVGEPEYVHVVVWHDGQAMWYGDVSRDRSGRPVPIFGGDTVSIRVPITGVLS